MNPWTGVDLDGTLAHYDGWRGPEHIGDPVPAMLERVQRWLAEGREVRIFTARIAHDPDGVVLARIQQWCEQHVGQQLEVTCEKDYGMIELWDDRCVQVVANQGRRVDSADGTECVWISDDWEMPGYNETTCGQNFNFVDSHDVFEVRYCPYCGRPIRMVHLTRAEDDA